MELWRGSSTRSRKYCSTYCCALEKIGRNCSGTLTVSRGFSADADWEGLRGSGFASAAASSGIRRLPEIRTGFRDGATIENSFSTTRIRDYTPHIMIDMRINSMERTREEAQEY